MVKLSWNCSLKVSDVTVTVYLWTIFSEVLFSEIHVGFAVVVWFSSIFWNSTCSRNFKQVLVWVLCLNTEILLYVFGRGESARGIGVRPRKSICLSVYKDSFLAGGYSSIDWKILNNDLLLSCFWKLIVASRYPKPLVPLEKPAKEVVSPETSSTFGTVKKKSVC